MKFILDCVDTCSQQEHITYDDFKRNILDSQANFGWRSPLDLPNDTMSADSTKSIKHSTPIIQSG